MKMFDVQSIDLNVPRGKAMAYISDPAKLPQWTNAFSSATAKRAILMTPNGQVEIGLEVQSSPQQGTVDWRMIFPDGNVATAFSRLIDLDQNHCLFSFILTPPPVPLEQLEGTMEMQSKILTEELKKLKTILENHG